MGQLNIRLTEGESKQLERLQERLQERERPEIRVTQRITVLRALRALETYLDKLDREQERKR